MKNSTWIIVANSSLSKIYETEGTKPLTLIETFEHPESHLSGRELMSDKEGRNTWGVVTHMVEEKMPPKLKEANVFAKQIIEFVERAHREGRCHFLYLIAAPAFLGILRHTLSDNLSKIVKGEIDRDLTHTSPSHIQDYLPPVL
jgi:protein required for attachment to host cells